MSETHRATAAARASTSSLSAAGHELFPGAVVLLDGNPDDMPQRGHSVSGRSAVCRRLGLTHPHQQRTHRSGQECSVASWRGRRVFEAARGLRRRSASQDTRHPCQVFGYQDRDPVPGHRSKVDHSRPPPAGPFPQVAKRDRRSLVTSALRSEPVGASGQGLRNGSSSGDIARSFPLPFGRVGPACEGVPPPAPSARRSSSSMSL